MSLSREGLEAILAAGDFDKWIGQVETPWFDAKGQPYDIDTDRGKRELARDVAAFANSGGGVILIGARTEKSAVHFADEIVKIRPLERQRVHSGRYRSVVMDWVFPDVVGFNVEWLPAEGDARGLFLIRIPAQSEERKPFLVVRTLDGERIVETLFGYAERHGDSNRSLGIVDLQRALRAGFNYERIFEERLGAIEAALRKPPTTTTGHDLEAAASGNGSRSVSPPPVDGSSAEDRTLVFPGPVQQRLEFEQSFWDALIQLPSWPESFDAVAKLLLDISIQPEQGILIEGTAVRVAKTRAELSDGTAVRFVVYFTFSEDEERIIVLFVDDYDHPSDPTERPHSERLPNHIRSH